MYPAAKARIAGLAYLVIIIAATFAEQFVRNAATVSGDAAATAANVLAREELWRWATAADLATATCDIIVALLLYEILKPLGKTVSLLAAVFNLILVAIAAVEILFHMAPLMLLKSEAPYLAQFMPGQLQDLSYLSLRLHGRAYDVSLYFFGIHCVLVGALIARATFLPRILGWLMILVGLCYLGNTLARVLAPELARLLYPWLFLPAIPAEGGLALWLLFRGVNSERWHAQATAAEGSA